MLYLFTEESDAVLYIWVWQKYVNPLDSQII